MSEPVTVTLNITDVMHLIHGRKLHVEHLNVCIVAGGDLATLTYRVRTRTLPVVRKIGRPLKRDQVREVE